MKLNFCRFAMSAVILGIAIISAAQQDLTPPIPKKLTLHSNVLNEDRVIWIRTPQGYDRGTSTVSPCSTLQTAPGTSTKLAAPSTSWWATIECRRSIVVGIANTDRTRDLTPTHSDEKAPDGTIAFPTSGGADRFHRFHSE